MHEGPDRISVDGDRWIMCRRKYVAIEMGASVEVGELLAFLCAVLFDSCAVHSGFHNAAAFA
jgi:hypothetical protein